MNADAIHHYTTYTTLASPSLPNSYAKIV